MSAEMQNNNAQQTQYEVHPAAAIFPMMTEEEYQGLKQDIAENGQRDDIPMWCGQIVDGRNRLRACEELGLEPRIADLDEDTEPWKYVISYNLHRRHLSSSQRAMVASAIATGKNGSNQHGVEGGQNCPPSSTIDAAATSLNVSPMSVKLAKVVQQHGSDAVKKAVEQGKLPVSLAAKLVKKEPDKRKQTRILSGGVKDVREAVNPKKNAEHTEDDLPPCEDDGEVLQPISAPVITSPPQPTHHPKEMAGPLMAHVKTLTQMLNDLKKRSVDRGGEWIDLQAISNQISSLKYSLKSSIYYADCPACGGKRCGSCKQSGFLPALKKAVVDGAQK